MASRRASIPNQGFTLLEVLIVLAMLALVGGVTLLVGIHTFRASFSTDDRSMLATLLQEARAQAMQGVCLGAPCSVAQAHGVHLGASQFVLFQGTSFDPNDSNNDDIKTNGTLEWSGASDIIFEPYSGDATPASITLTSANGSTSTLQVGALGDISWSN